MRWPILFLACARSVDPVTPATASFDASLSSAEEAAIDASAGDPPTGYYKVTTAITQNNCKTAAVTGTEEKPILIFAKYERGRRSINTQIENNRFDMEIGRTLHSQSSGCGATRDFEVSHAEHDTIQIRYAETFGDGSACRTAPAERNCWRERLFTYRLVKSLCEAPCNAADVDGGALLKCACN